MQVYPREQYLVLRGLAAEAGEVGIQALAERLGVDQALLAAGAQLLGERGLVAVREAGYQELLLQEAGREAVARGLPERRILEALAHAGNPLAIQDLPGPTGLAPKEIGAALRYLARKGWAEKSGAEIALLPAALEALPGPGEDERLLAALAARDEGRALDEELEADGLPVAAALEWLKGRREYLEVRAKRRRFAALTAAGREAVAAGVTEAREVGQLTPELLASGEWRTVRFKAYDVRLGVQPRHPGKPHPLQRVIAATRRAFLEMGFEEIVSPTVESAFWNFDALFQPQDHPAREMQDTFYLAAPARIELPDDAALVERVRRTHESGGDTGSLGWGPGWSGERAEAAVLRTHTTAATVRALAARPRGPRKVFTVGRVFRREAIDYKHLPLFHQVDGIIIDERGTFANLLGTLSAFYRKMGFERIELRPGFFPYTEPSVEVFIWVEAKQDWFEMGARASSGRR